MTNMNPRYLWHVTSRDRLSSIFRDGLTTAARGWETGYVWGFGSQDAAEACIERGDLDGDVVLRIDTDMLPVIANPHPGWGQGNEGTWAIEGGVSPNRLTPYRA